MGGTIATFRFVCPSRSCPLEATEFPVHGRILSALLQARVNVVVDPVRGDRDDLGLPPEEGEQVGPALLHAGERPPAIDRVVRLDCVFRRS